MTTHRLKCQQPWYSDLLSRVKTFDLRLDDRNYKVGDTLVLQEYSEKYGYTGREFDRQVMYILRDFPGLKEGYCILGV